MEKWQESHQRWERGTTAPRPASTPTADPFLSAIFDELAIEPEGSVVKNSGLHNEVAEVREPVSEFFAKAEFNVLAKTSGVSNESWDAPLVKGASNTNPRASAPNLIKLIRVERDGEIWAHGYDHSGELVRSRFIQEVA